MADRTEQSAELSPLKRALIALDQMQARLETLERSRREPIAIVGIGCRFPGGVDGPDSFWELLRDGTDAITDVPADRWDIDSLYDPDPDAPGKMSTRRGGFLSDVRAFDPQFFGIAPREASSMDPQQRLLLEVAWEALEHAGIAPDRLSGSRTGVFIGMASSDYAQVQLEAAGLAGLDAYYTSGIAHSIASGRVSYLLGLQGPSITLDTACSSSLVAVHLAVQSLRAEESYLALAGGVNLMLSPENSIMLSKYHMMAPDGRCKAFDAAADGFVRGEGCGVVVLKRLGDAVADGDQVLAVIRGSAVNQDGPSSGLTAPNGPAQEAVIREAIANAGVEPHEVGYVEAHGTGTALGDPIEVQALAAALGSGRPDDSPLAIGSVKTNVGHLEAVAGVAGLIKVVLVLEHGEIPPHLHLRAPNPHIDWPSLPVVVPTDLRVWPGVGGRRVAGVSGFGFSGTNAHVVLESAPVAVGEEKGSDGPQVLVWSGRSEAAVRELAGRYAAHLGAHPELSLVDVCATASTGRAHLTHRAAVVADTTDQARHQLEAFAGGRERTGVISGEVTDVDASKVAFLFTGQGSQCVGMGGGLYRAEPVFRGVVDRCDEVLRPLLPYGLLEVLYGADERVGELVHDTAFTQPALFVLEYALAELWRSWGVRPLGLLGHSVGEYVAAALAGVFSVEDALRLVAARGRLMQALPAGGSMAAVLAPVAEVEAVVAPLGAAVAVAAVNGPAHTVVSGESAVVEQVGAVFAARGVGVQPLRVSHGFHSPLMAPMVEEFAAVAATVEFRPPQRRVISNVTGAPIGAELADPAYWVHHVLAPVQFAAGLEALSQLGCDTFVEIGPHPVLTAMAQAVLPDHGTWVSSLRRQRDDHHHILHSLATLYTTGTPIDWTSHHTPHSHHRTPLPTYPFQRQHHWVRTRRRAVTAVASEHPVLGRRLSSPLDLVTFESQIGVDAAGYLDDHRVFGTAILPATAFIEMAMSAGASRDGGCAVLEDVVIHEALIIDDDGLVTMHTVLSPEAGGASLRIFSRTDGQEEWKLHVTARLRDGAIEPAPAASIETIRARCSEEVAADEHYALLRERGLAFGPSLQGVQRIWKCQEEALGEVALPGDQTSELGRYRIHPALLDAALQLLADIPALGDETYLPIGIDRVELHDSTPVAWAHSHVRVRPDPARRERPETLTADLSLLDDAGRSLLVLEGVHFKRADKGSLLRAGHQERAGDGTYEVAWRQLPSAEVDDAGEHRDAVPTASLAERLTNKIDELSEEHELDRYEGLLAELDGLSTDYIVVALERLGVPFGPGARFSATDLGVTARHRDLLLHLLDLLADDGLVRPVGDEWEVLRGRSGDTSEARVEALLQRYPAGRGELMITRRCGERLAEALVGDVDPLQLLFPGGSLENAEEMYQLSPFARFYNALAGEAVAAAVADLPPTRRLRVLEIGAGTGGTSSFVLPRLPADQVEYTFTDVSPHFLGRAGQKFADLPFLDYRTLDIERDPASQGFGEQQFDIVVAANVLHATSDLRRTFAHVAKLLVPGGLLVMVEMVQVQRFISITFGLTDGWWKFSDIELRPSSLLLTTDGWLRFLEDVGFDGGLAVPAGAQRTGSARGVQTVVVARAAGGPVDPSRPPVGRRRWLVLSDGDGVGDAVGEVIHARGDQVVVATPGSAYGHTGPDRFQVGPSRMEDFVRLLRDGAGAGFDGVVYLWALDRTVGSAAEAMELRLGGALGLTQALAAEGLATRLWFVTRGAQPAAGAVPDAEQAPLWGFARTVALEHPELQPRCLDLDPSPAADTVNDLVDALLAGHDEDQLAVRRGERLAARLVHWAPAPPAEPVELSFTERGTLDHLVLRPAARRPPGRGEVEIRVHATGLNFKDVLNVLGMYPGDPGPVGGECAGVVVAVGPEVTDLHVGDAVVALAPGSFRSHVTCSSALVAPKPTGMSFADAAGLLIANVTAEFALHHVGHLGRGERLLIHAGSGGVGLAAIGLAQRCGAEVYATAGSEHKRALLASLGVAHVYDSRSLAFADQVLADTDGAGVDVVLNSLAGEFVTRSIDLLGKNGRFLEIGKRDHLTADAATDLGGGRTYHVIDWGETAREDPALIRSIVMDVVGAAASGRLPAMPISVFPLSDASTAFRFMAQARHVGKVVVTQPEAASDRTPPAISSEATYLITGGLSGLGLLTARQLVQSGARHLALMGRREPSDAACREIAALEAEGARVAVLRGDVSSRTDVEQVLAEIATTMPPLRGVFHSAGALDDGALGQQTWARFSSVLSAKVDGARHLDELTADAALDHFVLYSSIASMVGSPGQANHAAANAFLDALAHRRAALGRPALSINWGAWSEIGAAAERGVDKRVAELGLGAISPAEGMARLEQLMGHASPQVGVIPVEWQVLLRRYGVDGPPPYFSELSPTVGPEVVVTAPARQVDVLRELAEAAPNRREGIVLALVRDQSAHVLDLPPRQVDDRTPLSEVGLDSLMAVELRNLLGTALGIARPLPATLVFDYPTVAAITEYLVEEVLDLGGADRATPGEDVTSPSSSDGTLVSALLDDLEHLSDDHIDQMLELRTRR